jgi:glycine oxidase
VIGCAVAFELATRGYAVSVWESRQIGGGATHASAGILAPYIEAHEGSVLFDLTVRGLRMYGSFVDRLRAATPRPFEFRRCGTIEIADNHRRAEDLRKHIRDDDAMTWLDSEQLRALEPSSNPASVGGRFCPEHGFVAVNAFVDALKDGAERRGAVFTERVAVSAIHMTPRGCALQLEDGSEVTSDRIVLCTGAWARHLDPAEELRGLVRPVRGQLVRLWWPDGGVQHVLWGESCYIVPWPDGTLLLGATSEEVGFDETATVDGVAGLLAAGERLLPGVGSAVFDGVRVGLRPATGDSMPIIGVSPSDARLVYAVGHFRNGVLLAPLTAELVGNLIVDGITDPVLAATSIARYTSGA